MASGQDSVTLGPTKDSSASAPSTADAATTTTTSPTTTSPTTDDSTAAAASAAASTSDIKESNSRRAVPPSPLPIASDAPEHNPNPSPTVRFVSNVETISPEPPEPSSQRDTPAVVTTPPTTSGPTSAAPAGGHRDNKDRSKTLLQGALLQERRINIYSFEPYSLPPSRIPSQDDQSALPSRQVSRSTLGLPSPSTSLRTSDMQSPPLTPAGTDPARSTDDVTGNLSIKTDLPEKPRPSNNDASAITPQASSQGANSPLGQGPSTQNQTRGRPMSFHPADPTPSPDGCEFNPTHHRKGLFNNRPKSLPVSRESSPSRPASEFFTRPLTPSGDHNHPYAASKRQPQDHKNLDSRFVFSRKKKWNSSGSYPALPRSGRSETSTTDKRRSMLASLSRKNSEVQKTDSNTPTIHSRQSSMSDLRTVFKAAGAAVGINHGKKASISKKASSKPKSNTPSKLSQQVPFGDDHGLSTKWGRLGKVLGSGAGGSVRLMKRNEDGTVFAVKEFRPRHSYENDKDYVKKLTAEFCIGSTLHHGNVIETLDIVSEKGKWYEVMEYAPYDLFAIVMTGKMSRAEISCCWLQILSGVTFLHSMGLAHRDLKLDNVVVSENGIMKLIDFGSAHVFQYSFETSSVKAAGIVGSDPYLAPEVYDDKKYDAAAVDIWSLAIIYCCLTLRRFPWKVPRLTDSSYKLFASPPSPGHDPEPLLQHRKHSADSARTRGSLGLVANGVAKAPHSPVNKTNNSDSAPPKETVPPQDTAPPKETVPSRETAPDDKDKNGEPKKEVVKGPWRLLRLLPRESRYIIFRMLDLDPEKRAKMEEILEEPWIANTVICRQLEPGQVVMADDHTHVLEPPINAPKLAQ